MRKSGCLRIISVVGARPQFIKAAAVSRAIAQRNREPSSCPIVEKIVHTGQHYDDNMSQVFFDEMDIPQPDYNLGVGSASHGAQTGRMLECLEEVLVQENPDCVLVYGDTNTTLAGALAASKRHIPVGHVEAGMRSYNRRMPEEINRVVADHLSELLFCPTETAVKNLEREGIRRGVHLVGDVMYDCALFYATKARAIEQRVMNDLKIRPKSYHLATIHRAENTDDRERLARIAVALGTLGAPDCPVVFPMHPRTLSRTRSHGVVFGDHVRVIEPVSYLTMVVLQRNARMIITDSGGVQKEALFYAVPCVTLREETEWPETLQNGWNRLLPPTEDIKDKLRAVTEEPTGPPTRPFGSGTASNEIVRVLLA